jgi:omega-amidase
MSTLTITTIQSNLFWEDKKANLDMFEKKIEAIEERTEIIILPEMFSTGFTMNPSAFAEKMDGITVSWMKEQSRKKNIVLTGSIIIEESGNYYNRLLWVLPNGEIGYYDKRHLFGLVGENNHYAAGNKRLIASVKGWRINLQICYDLRFPVWSRQTKNDTVPEYDVLLYVANWPERRSAAWKTLLAARAIENQCFVVGVNRVGNDGNGIYHSGDSMVINPLGEILHHAAHEENSATITLKKDLLNEIRMKFPFLKDGDDFFIQ